jgi:hypothetical protein
MKLYLPEPVAQPEMKIYLRLLAAIYAFACLRHIANMLGFGELPWAEAPLAWQISDIAYAILDAIAASGLFLQRRWGIVAFLLAAASEILLFTLVPDWFVMRPEHLTLLRGFVAYHIVAIAIWLFLLLRQKRSD